MKGNHWIKEHEAEVLTSCVSTVESSAIATIECEAQTRAKKLIDLPLELLSKIIEATKPNLEQLSTVALICRRFHDAASNVGASSVFTKSKYINLPGLVSRTVRIFAIGGLFNEIL